MSNFGLYPGFTKGNSFGGPTADVRGAEEGDCMLTARMPVAANDLVAVLESGDAVRVDPNRSIPSYNNNIAGPVVFFPKSNAGYVANQSAPNNMLSRLCELSNGNVAEVYTGNGSVPDTNVNIRIRSIAGADIIGPIIVSTETNVKTVRIAPISNTTTFLVTWNAAASLKFAIYHNDGTLSVAATPVATLEFGDFRAWNFACLTGGGFVVAYNLVSSQSCCFKRYNSSGVLQGGETIVEASSHPHPIRVLPCSDGGFIVKYFRAKAPIGTKFARYNDSGVIQGSLTTIVVSANRLGAFGFYDNTALELADGNILFIEASASDGYPDLYIYDSANTLLRTVDLGTANILAEIPGVAVTSLGFAISYRNLGPNTYLRTFSNNGDGIVPETLIDSTGFDNSTADSAGTLLFALGSAGFACLRLGYRSSGPLYDLRLFCCSPTGSSLGTPVQLRASEEPVVFGLAAYLTQGMLLVFGYYDGTSARLTYGIYNVVRSSIFGVAKVGSPTSGGFVAATRGTFAINQLAIGSVFDARSNTVPGNRGWVSGNLATLLGLEPAD